MRRRLSTCAEGCEYDGIRQNGEQSFCERPQTLIANYARTRQTEAQALCGWQKSRFGSYKQKMGGETGGGEAASSPCQEGGGEEIDPLEVAEEDGFEKASINVRRRLSPEHWHIKPGEESGGKGPGQESCESGSGGKDASPTNPRGHHSHDTRTGCKLNNPARNADDRDRNGQPRPPAAMGPAVISGHRGYALNEHTTYRGAEFSRPRRGLRLATAA